MFFTKAALLAERPAEVLYRSAPTRSAEDELYARRHELFDTTSGWPDAAASLVWPNAPASLDMAVVSAAAEESPLVATALGIPDDVILLTRGPQGWRLGAGCVCFPTRWSLRRSAGRSLTEIHAPVPGLNAALGNRIETVLDRLRPTTPMWRINWSIVGDWNVRLEPGEPDQPLDDRHGVAGRCLRIEYQRLQRLPDTNAIVFSIRILRRRVDTVIHDGTAAALAESLSTMPADIAAYKADTSRYTDQIVAWLASN